MPPCSAALAVALALLASPLHAEAQPYAVSGIVYCDGIPVPNTLVEAIPVGMGAAVASSTTDGSGYYLFAVPAGNYDFHIVPPPSSDCLETTDQNISIQADTTYDIFLLKPGGGATQKGNLTGVLTGLGGNPVEGALVCVAGCGYTATTNAAGRYTFTDLPVGNYRVEMYGGNATSPWVPQGFSCNSSPGATVLSHQTTTFDLALQVVRISGDVEGLSGERVPGSTVVVASSFNDGTLFCYSSFSVLTDPVDATYDQLILRDLGNGTATPPAGTPYTSVTDGNIALLADAVHDFILPDAYLVQGTVTGYLGHPVEGAAVYFAGTFGGAATTDANGHYEIRYVGAGTYAPQVYGAGTESPPSMVCSESSVVVTGPTVHDVHLPIVDTFGTVRNVAGDPLAGVAVSASSSFDDGNRSCACSNGTGTDAMGGYLMKLCEGTASYSATHAAGTPYGDVSGDPPGGLTIAGDTQHDMVLPDANSSVEGTITGYGGAPVEGVLVRLTLPGVANPYTYTDANGFYRFENLNPGNYYIQLINGTPGPSVPQAYNCTHLDLAVMGAVHFDYALPVVRFFGTVTDARMQPIADVTMLAISTSAPAGECYANTATPTTDANGGYSVLLMAGDVRIYATPPAGSPYGAVVDSGVPAPTDTRHDMVLPDLYSVAGTIFGDMDLPVEGALAGPGYGYGFETYGVTDANGDYLTGYVLPGHYRLQVNYSAGTSPVVPHNFVFLGDEFDVVGDTTGIDAHITSVHLTGLVTDENGAPIAGMTGTGTSYPGNSPYVYSSSNILSDIDGRFHYLLFPGTAYYNFSPPAGSGFVPISISGATLAGDTFQRLIFRRPDTTEPVIIQCAPQVMHLSDDSVTIGWTTNEPSDSFVEYGTGALSSSAFDGAMVTTHLVTLTGLLPGTTYGYQVSSTDFVGNGPTRSVLLTFTTTTAPGDNRNPSLAVAPQVVSIGTNIAYLVFETDEPARATAEWGVPPGFTESLTESGFSLRHVIPLASLAPSTNYQVRVSLVDPSGNSQPASAPIDFQSASTPDLTPPVITSGPDVSDVTDGTITVIWNTDELADSRISFNDGVVFDLVHDHELTTHHVVTLAGLTAGLTYHVTASSSDAFGNGPTLAATKDAVLPPDPSVLPPTISNLQIGSITANSAIATWDTSEPSHSRLQLWDRSIGPDMEPDFVMVQLELVSAHSALLTGLRPGRTYDLRIEATDRECSTALAATTFATLAEPCAGVVCPPSGVPCRDSVCDPLTGACTLLVDQPDGTACSDGNACTAGDSCQMGACVAGLQVACAPPDQCHDAGTCDPGTGTCVYPNRPNGTLCSDGNACTQGDSCQMGSCTGVAVVCPAADQCHNAGVCDPQTGLCSNPPKPDGTACSDGNACSLGDTCESGACTGSTRPAANMNGANEVPGPGDADGFGTVQLTLDEAGGQVCYHITFGNIATPPTAAHIHTGAVGVPGPVFIGLFGANGPFNDGCVAADPARIRMVRANPPGFYVNVHNTPFPGGAIRGQLAAQTLCTASDQCHDPGTCDPQTGMCSNPPKPAGAPCSDGNACTTGDTCAGGACLAGFETACPAPDQCHNPGVCDPQTGLCSNPPKPNGTACSDGNACTTMDTCQVGACTSGAPVVCPAPDQCHNAGVCDPQSGLCSNPPKPDGTACSDGNACSRGDTCENGACTGSTQPAAIMNGANEVPGPGDPDGFGTVQLTLDEAGGQVCYHITFGNIATPPTAAHIHTGAVGVPGPVFIGLFGANGPFNDGCVAADPARIRMVRANPPGFYVNVHNTPFPGGAIRGQLAAQTLCTASDQCHDPGTCDPQTGMCSNPPKPAGAPCSDGNACTTGDTCAGGACLAGFEIACPAPDQCHNPGVCDPQTGLCSNPPKPNGTACSDGNACTTNDSCQLGSCTGGPTPDCDDLNACTNDSCNPLLGCQHMPNSAPCSDNNPCTVGDTCAGGVCVPGPGPNCDDGNPCTTDSCDLLLGCFHLPNTDPCNDGNACTTNDTCTGGACVGGAAADCDDLNPCTDDSCNPASGCVHTNNANPCSDGNACTTNDTCRMGTCIGAPLACPAPDQCHDPGTCDPQTGICSNPARPDGTACSDGNACTLGETCQGGQCVAAAECSGVFRDRVFAATSFSAATQPVYELTSSGKTQFATVNADGWVGPLRITCAGRMWVVTRAFGVSLYDITAGGDQTMATPFAQNLFAAAPSYPEGLDFDAAGNAYVSNSEAGLQPLAIVAPDGSVTHTATLYSNATSLLRSGDTLYISEAGTGRVLAHDLVTGIDTPFATGFRAGNDHVSGQLVVDKQLHLLVLWSNAISGPGLYDITGGGDFSNAMPLVTAPFRIDVNQCGIDSAGSIYCAGDGTSNAYVSTQTNGMRDPFTVFATGLGDTESLDVGPTAAATGTNLDCDDGNPCTTDSCDPALGCQHAPNNDPCDDHSACTTGDTCVGGACVGGPAPSCDDGNPCTNDSCDPVVGCVHVNNAAPCSDGNACTTNDICAGGACVGGPAPSCEDGNLCTDDSCDPLLGCRNQPNNAPCTDGNACTLGDVCVLGACQGGPGAPICDDLNPCTDDSCNPAIGCTSVPNTHPCDDGSPCTSNDVCTGGACVGGPAPSCDDGNPCTTDLCQLGSCSNIPNADPCNDGNPCTTLDRCVNGACAGGPPRNCDDGNPCTDDSCDPALGCQHAPNSAPCSDNNPCTVDDTCAGGACVPGPGPTCDDGNPCTTDSCDLLLGCLNLPNTDPCDDGDACTTSDTCAGGACVGGPPPSCDDGNPCTFNTCIPAFGCLNLPSLGPCDDGNACTTVDVCGGDGTCGGSFAVNCNDNNVCTDDSCDPAAGCQHVPNMVPCDDADVCNGREVCGGGVCQPGMALNCDDGNACTFNTCIPAFGCLNLPSLGLCDDGNACTTVDLCDGAGTCRGTFAVNCNDNNACTDDSCDPPLGCVHAPNAAPCSDGSACTTNDHCAGGHCVVGAALDCNDGNPCTADLCSLTLGCLHQPSPAPCSDGNACTTNDSCSGGSCVGGPALNCNDMNPCTDDACDPTSGCLHAPNAAPCSDGNACTTGDVCAGGACIGGPAPNCDDGNPCTTDSCDPVAGCLHANNMDPCNDGNACTTGDVCAHGMCAGTPTPQCGCMTVTDEQFACSPPSNPGPGNYSYTFTVSNTSGVTARYVLLPTNLIHPNVFTLTPPLPSGQSRTVTVLVSNVQQPPVTFCFDVILADDRFNECCSIHHCITPPPCGCMALAHDVSECIPGAPAGTFRLRFDLTNLTPQIGEHVFLIPPFGSGTTVTPEYIDIPPLPTGGTLPVGPVQIEGAVPGQQLCITVTLHDETLQECCSVDLCVTVPQPCTCPDGGADGGSCFSGMPGPAQGGVSVGCSVAAGAGSAAGLLGALLALMVIQLTSRRRRGIY